MGRYQNITIEEWRALWEGGERAETLVWLTEQTGSADLAESLLPYVYDAGCDKIERQIAYYGLVLHVRGLVLHRYQHGKLGAQWRRGPRLSTEEAFAIIERIYLSDFNRVVGHLWRRADAWGKGISWQEAEDLTADSFTELHRQLSRGDGIETPRALLYVIGRKKLAARLGELRYESAFPEWDENGDSWSGLQDMSVWANPERSLIRNAMQERVRAALAGLPPIALDIASRRWADHEGLKTISDELGIPYEEVYRLSWEVRHALEAVPLRAA